MKSNLTLAHRPSVMIVTPDSWLADRIAGSIDPAEGIVVSSETATLRSMNGRAVEMLKTHDLILFQTAPDTADDIAALEAMKGSKPPGAKLVALADGSLTIAEAQALARAGADEVLPLPFDIESLGSHVAKLLKAAPEPARTAAPAKRGAVIAVAQARGGIGATTVAVNLADLLAGGGGKAKDRPRVALLDLDLQFGTIGTALDLPEQEALLQMAMDGTIPDATFLDQAMTRLPTGLAVLAAPAKFAPLDSLTVDQVEAIIDILRASHDYVVIDLPRALVNWVEPVIQAADRLILVTDVSIGAIRHCRRLAEFFTTTNVALKIEVVVNRQRKPLFLTALQREASKALGRPLDVWLPADRAAQAAADGGRPLSAAAPRAPLTRALRRLADRTTKSVTQQIQPAR